MSNIVREETGGVPGTSPRPRGRPRKENALPAPADAVFAAVLHAFGAHGYHGVSMRTLNRELGVSHNLLHQRFGSKDKMWYAAVDWGFGNLVRNLLAATADENQPPLERLRRFIRIFVAFSAGHPDLLRIVNIEAGEESERLDYLCQRFIIPVNAKVVPLYTELVEAGRLRAVPFQTVYFMIASGGAAMFSSQVLARTLFTDAVFTPAEIERHADAAADLIINGLLTSPPSPESPGPGKAEARQA
jgi:TetR/AcrR family transcriptional regulator